MFYFNKTNLLFCKKNQRPIYLGPTKASSIQSMFENTVQIVFLKILIFFV